MTTNGTVERVLESGNRSRQATRAFPSSPRGGRGGWQKVSRANPCPICGKPDWCRVTSDGLLAHCHRVSLGGTPWPGLAGGHLHRLTDAPAVGFRVVEPPPRYTGTPLPPDRVDAIGRALLDVLPLLPEHREDLLRRGFTQDEIGGRGYRSLPYSTRGETVQRLKDLFREEDLLRFPGFVMKQGRYSPYLWLTGAEGILIPVRDAERRIVAFRIRPDISNGGGKYRWLSSSAHDGPSPGTPLHIARPLSAAVAFDPDTVYVTEGEIKADLAANRFGAIVLSVPGVSIRTGVVPALLALGAKRVVLAFDADKTTKPQVLAAELALAQELRRANFETLAATWPLEAGKGIDDLLAAGKQPAIAAYTFPKETRAAGRRLEVAPREWVEARLPAPPPLLPIEEARDHVRAHVTSLFHEEKRGVFVVRATPGVGKTTISLQVLQEAIASGALGTRRVLVSMERIDLIEEVLARDEFEELRKASIVRYGRTAKEDSPGFCADMRTTTALARKRQGVMRSYCVAEGETRCPHAADCAYLARLRQAKGAQVVFAATALLRTEATELADFDIFLVDEALDTALVDPLRVTREDVDIWRDGLPAGEESFRPFLQVLAHALAAETQERRVPLLKILRHAAGLLGTDLGAVVGSVLSASTDKEGRLACEVPRTNEEQTLIPLRALRDVAEILRAELSRPANADTRAWMIKGAEGSLSMEFRSPRRRLVETLSQATTINLDATPNLPKLRLVFTDLDVLSISVPEAVEVVQLVDALYVSDTVEKHAVQLGQVLAQHFEGASRPAIFCEKRFRPDLERKGTVLSVERDDVSWGHFGGNSRGTNTFSDADALGVVGHFLPPIDETEADVQALRFAAVPPPRGADEVLVPYSGRTADEGSRARWVKRHTDPDVAQVLDHQRAAMIHQVIGRGRPSLRPEGAPIRVILAAGWPVPELPIARLTTRAELLGRMSTVGDTCPSHVAELNTRRHEEFAARVDQAAQAMKGRGKGITARGVARELDLSSGRSVSRIAEHIGTQQLPHQLGVPHRRLKGDVSAGCGVHPVDGFSWIGPRQGRSTRPNRRNRVQTGLGRVECLWLESSYGRVRGPPLTELMYVPDVLVKLVRKARKAGFVGGRWKVCP